jgi:hypothetical protein
LLGALTTAVCGELAEAEPAELPAVTTARSAWLASPAASRYDELVAPPMFVQLTPAESQSCH